jgi:nitrite reductase/ring-hydroxylating ferredoxin subunit
LFVPVGRIDEFVPGQGRMVVVNGRHVALFRLREGFFAIDNTCLHRGGPLCEGFVEDGPFTSAPA